MGGLPAGVKTSVVPGFLPRLYSVPALDWWWVRVPARLRRYSVTLSTAWADGLCLTAWPRLAVLLSISAALVGAALGASHWSPYVIGENSISTAGPITVFAESLPFLFIAVLLGSLSAHLGLMLTFGYMVGEYLIAGPATATWGYNSAWPLFLGERLPLLLCYWLLFILAARTTLTSNALAASLLRSVRGNDAAAIVLRVGATAVFQFALVYAWVVATPMIIRIVWIWTGRGSSPFTVPGYLDFVAPWVPLAAAVAVVLRGFLMHRALSSKQVKVRLRRLLEACRYADAEPAFSRRMPLWLRALIAAAALTFLISGLLLSFEYAAAMFLAFLFILLVRAFLLPNRALWRAWATVAARVPLAARLCAATALVFLISRFVVAVPGPLNGQGKFGIELICIVIGLPVMLLLAANGERSTKSTVGGSETTSIFPSIDSKKITRAAGSAVMLLCLFSAGKAHASCFDDLCCLVKLAIAAVLVAAILWMAWPVIVAFLGALFTTLGGGELLMAGRALAMVGGFLLYMASTDPDNDQEIEELTEPIVREAPEITDAVPALITTAEDEAEEAEEAATDLIFGRDDLVYGPSAEGALRDLVNQAGGQLLTDMPKPPDLTWTQFSLQTLDDAAANGRMIRFDLSNVYDVDGVLDGSGQFARTVTGDELRHIQDNWGTFQDVVKFYRDGSEVSPPWLAN